MPAPFVPAPITCPDKAAPGSEVSLCSLPKSKKSQNSNHTQNIKPADTFPLTPEQTPDSLPGWEGPAPSPDLPLCLVWLFSSSSAMPQPPWPPLLFLRLAPVSRPSPESLPSWPYFLSPQIPAHRPFLCLHQPKERSTGRPPRTPIQLLLQHAL